MTTTHDKLRDDFRPERITTLFVGESPPTGGTFFYLANSILFRSMHEAFSKPAEFLLEFQNMGFFLDDLVLHPIDKQERKERERSRLEAIPHLAARLIAHSPAAVVAIMRAIEPCVSEAMRQAGLVHVPLYVTAFPGRYHRRTFLAEMSEIVPKLPVAPSYQSDV